MTDAPATVWLLLTMIGGINRSFISVERSMQIHCQVDIGDHNLFFNAESQTVPAYVGIEFMAQSVAAWSGYHALKSCGHHSPYRFPAWFIISYKSLCDEFTQGQTLDICTSLCKEERWRPMAVMLPQESNTKASW